MAARTTDELLAGVPLFAGLSPKELRVVGSLATRLDVPAGATLAHQGRPGREFIVVLEGSVDVLIDDEVVATCGAGDYFGEIALLEHGTRTATVVARTDGVVDVINQAEFATLLADHPGIAETLRATRAQRLAENAAHHESGTAPTA
jgi:CRP/FNR family transcriptional regulator, cyclic AMP receptor protein